MPQDHPAPAIFSRKNPFPATLIGRRRLTPEGSGKETIHIELSLRDSGLIYEVGDSLGVLPPNCPELVEDIIRALRCSGEEMVNGADGSQKSLRQSLLTDYQIKEPSRPFLQVIAERSADSGASQVCELLDPERKTDLDNYLWGLECIDFLKSHPSIRFTPEEFVGLLRKLQPRLYSIASSQKMFPDAAHLTVAVVRYESHGRKRKGVASAFLADRAGDGTPIPVFVHPAKGFRLPESPDTPIIMVGPGTGVAPFRAFLEERKMTGARGRNWLFFGERRRATDFLYGEELERYHAEGVITRLDTAFSRDQAHKIYVQHRMMENALEIWKWIEEGAHFFVCGDARKMAKDVDTALHKIIETEGGRTPEQASEYVETLKKQKRYKRDVY
jgi:sulfite reductase (NADPH) flavoprotein alpha-component